MATGNSAGTVFKVSLSGSVQWVYTFNPGPLGTSDGNTPSGPLVQDNNFDGNYYGVTYTGGANNGGAIYKITALGAKSIVYSFPNSTGYDNPTGPLVMDSSGNLYGTTLTWNTTNGTPGGSVFKFTPPTSPNLTGTIVWQHEFTGIGANNGDGPGNLLMGQDGNLYGTLVQVDGAGSGGIFRITTAGTNTTVVASGLTPAGLMQGGDGNFYGTCSNGGTYNDGTVWQLVASTTLPWQYGWRYSFNHLNYPDGAYPLAGLVQASDGYFYGTTSKGGGIGAGTLGYCGTIFRVDGSGTETPVFDLPTIFSVNSTQPCAAIIQTGNGILYGSAMNGQYIFSMTLPPESTYALWNYTSTNQAALWRIAASGAHSTATFGPYSGLTPVALSSDTAGNAYVLWGNASGAMRIDKVSSTLALVASQTFTPVPNWTAKSIGVGPDGHIRVLWTGPSDAASIWNIVLNSSLTSQAYGPYTGWQAEQIAIDLANNTRILWNDTALTEAALWNITSAGVQTSLTLGPFASWQAMYLAVGPANQPRVAWDCTATGEAALYYIEPNGTYTYQAFGPYSGWAPASLAVNSDGDSDLMWNSTANGMSLFDIPITGSFTDLIFGPYSGWVAVAVAAGP